MDKWFVPLKAEPRGRQVVAFDIEGSGGEGGFVVGAIVGDDLSEIYTDRKLMLKRLLGLGAEGAWIFAHNLQYDLPILEGEDFPTARLIFTRSVLLWADYQHWGRRVRMYDSRNLYPRHNVRGLGEIVHAPKLDLDPWLLERLSKGTPWAHFMPSDQTVLERYVRRDAEIVYLAVSLLQDIALRAGGQLKGTIAGVAMDIFRRQYMKWPWQQVGSATNQTVRPAYYGGRVENFCYGQVSGVNAYDVTSLYPAVQSEIKFPHPKGLTLELAPSFTSAWLRYEGVASVRLKVPEQHIPPAPYRFDHRLFFPVGELSGLWTLLELRAFLEMGVQLLSVDWVLFSKVLFNPFHDFIEALFKVRQGYLAQGQGGEHVIKLILNSLYGRWGLNPERSLMQLVCIEDGPQWERVQGYQLDTINNKLYAYGPIESDHQPPYVNVFFAAQITAAARLRLYEELGRQGEHAVYCDTDSILTRGEIQIGEGLGSWRCEMQDGTADLLGPKQYKLHNAVQGEKYIVAGVPERLAEAYLRDGAARFKRALAIREALAQGKQPATWVETYRTRGSVLPKRAPMAPLDGPSLGWIPTRPYLRQELPQVVAGRWTPQEMLSDDPELLRRVQSRPEQKPLL